MSQDRSEDIRLLSVKDVIDRLGVSKATVYRWRKSGQLPPPRRIGPNRVGWRSDELDAWIDSRGLADDQTHKPNEDHLVESATNCGPNDRDNFLLQSVYEFDLSTRLSNGLKAAEINTIGELISRTESELLSQHGFGKKSLGEIKAILNTIGLSLRARSDIPTKEEIDSARDEDWVATRYAKTLASVVRDAPPPPAVEDPTLYKLIEHFYYVLQEFAKELDRRAARSLRHISIPPHIIESALQKHNGLLDDRAVKILRLRYGLDGRERTLEEVGLIFDLSRERVRQIIAQALRSLDSHGILPEYKA